MNKLLLYEWKSAGIDWRKKQSMDNQYSVLMSLYDKEKTEYLKTSLDSILKQTILPKEIVLVLDGPITDEQKIVLNEYADHLILVPLEKNVGLGLALNEGLKHCSCQLVARMDTDDIMKPSRCEEQLVAFEEDPELAIVGTQIDEFMDNPEKSTTSRVVPTSHEAIFRFSKRRNPFNHPSVMYKRDTVLKYGGYNDIRRNQDFDLFVRMLVGGEKAKNLEKSLLYFRANKDNLMRRKSWQKVSSDIRISNNFRKMGHAGLLDFLIVSTSHFILFLSPRWLAKWISENLLRKKSENNEN